MLDYEVTMVFYGGLTLITVLLGWVVGRKGKIADRIAIIGIFLLLSLVSVLRVNIGNDYSRYTQIFHELRYDGYVITEPLFNRIVAWIMKHPFWWNQAYQVVFGVFAVATIGLFLKVIYDESVDFGMSFFLFMILGLYFQTFSTMRYYLALGMCVYAVRWITAEPAQEAVSCIPGHTSHIRLPGNRHGEWKAYLKFFLMVFVAAGLHKSALVVIPLYLIARLPWDTWKCKKWIIALFILLCIQFLVFQDFYKDIMLKIYWSYDEEDGLTKATISYVNIARCLGVFLLCLPVYRKAIQGNIRNRFWFTCNVFALALYTFGYYVPIISRFGYFLNVGQIFLIPVCIQAISKEKWRRWMTGLVAGTGMLFWVVFMRGIGPISSVAKDSIAILPYESWVFTEMEPVEMPVYTLLGIE